MTGASGLLGMNLALEAAREHQVFGLTHHHPLRTTAFTAVSADLLEPGAVERLPVTVPCAAGREQHTQVSAWALDPHTGMLFGGTRPDGFLFRLDPESRQVVGLGKPCRQDLVTCLTVGHDGRVFGMAGTADDIGHFFCHDPQTGAVTDLGIPVSTLTTRQYGYHYADAVTGVDGEMYFGQRERANYLWLYFPAVPRRSALTPAAGLS